MKRITVAITIDDAYVSARQGREMKNALLVAALEQAQKRDHSVIALDAKVGSVRKPR